MTNTKHVPDVATIHGVELHKLVERSKTIDAILNKFAARRRTRGFTDIGRLKSMLKSEGCALVDAEAEELFKVLEEQGFGVMVRSRRYGAPSKFLWKYDMRRVASAALEGKDTAVQELPKDMQRDKDGPRKRNKNTTHNKSVKSSTNHEKALNVGKNEHNNSNMRSESSTLPNKITINGRTFMDIPENEYNELLRLRDTIRKLVK